MERDTLSLSDLTGATTPPTKGEHPVKELLVLLGALVGINDVIALSDGGELPADVMQSLTALKDELPTLRQTKTDSDAFLVAARDALALGADADLKVVEGHILALAEKASTADALKSQVDKLALESETRKKDELKATGLAAGKLSAKQVESPWFQGLDSVQLDAFLEHAPKVVPVGPPTDPDKLPEDDAVILTDVQKQVAASGGYTKEQMIEAVKRQRKQEAATS
jgi:ribosome-binding ATPase YchF (GTP1/OBG family)